MSARQRQLPLTSVEVVNSGSFWGGLIDRMSSKGVFELLDHCESTGRIENLRRAARTGTDGPQEIFEGRYYDDSDVYKVLEAAAWAYGRTRDIDLRRRLDDVISVIEAAQDEDGYVNSYFHGPRRKLRWTDFDLHELYCVGHLVQAAVADLRSSGRRRLFDVAVRAADHVCAVFGPESSPGRLPTASFTAGGHPEIELALVELYRQTGDRRYLDMCGQFLRDRGHGQQDTGREAFGPEYFVDHAPLVDSERMGGHAVRALYLAAGATDYVLETGDAEYRAALDRLWTTMTERQMHVTGGLGARWENEAFGVEWELPSRAHAETCASIASIMWSARMAAARDDRRYHDNIELTLYNAVLAAMSADGQKYFYQNPLWDDGTRRRRPWFDTACCPTNMARFLVTLPSLIATASNNSVTVHQYISARISPDSGGDPLPSGSETLPELEINTDYPTTGRIEIAVLGTAQFTLRLRIPSWCGAGKLRLNGAPVEISLRSGYAELHRKWKAGDEVALSLEMAPHLIGSATAPSLWGRAAVARGPVIYCAEGVDNPGADPRRISLAVDAEGSARQLRLLAPPDVPGAATAFPSPGIEAAAVVHPEPSPEEALYRRDGPASPPDGQPFSMRMVPYAVWANRDPGPMTVWFRCTNDSNAAAASPMAEQAASAAGEGNAQG